MNARWKIFGLAAVIAGIAAAIVLSRQSPQQFTTVQTPPEHHVAPVAEVMPGAVEELPPAAPVKEPPVKSSAPKPKLAPQIQAQSPATPPAKEPLHDPDARDALALVGFDPAAEQYWLDAIYDSSLPDKEREDLMEDLNEQGFADPKNLTADDLPLIVNRLEIIDAILPNTDDFMRAHLLEAQKDLINMFGQVAGR